MLLRRRRSDVPAETPPPEPKLPAGGTWVGEPVEERVAEVATTRGALKFVLRGKRTTMRAFAPTKTPEMTEWIESFAPGSVFWDVGANVGAFSLYALLDPATRVLAFEPGAVNHYLLTRNVELNGFDTRASCFCLGFGARLEVAQLAASQELAGASFHMQAHTDGRFPGQETVLCFSMDEFAERFGVATPNYMKIDVPAVTGPLLDGAQRMLAEPGLREVMIELDRSRFDDARWARAQQIFERAGLSLDRTHQKNNPALADYVYVRR